MNQLQVERFRNPSLLIFAFLIGVSALTTVVRAPTPTTNPIWSVKYICNPQSALPKSGYDTVINVHNPSDTAVSITWMATVAVTTSGSATIAAHGDFEVSCFSSPATIYSIGFFEVHASSVLQVVAVYKEYDYVYTEKGYNIIPYYVNPYYYYSSEYYCGAPVQRATDYGIPPTVQQSFVTPVSYSTQVMVHNINTTSQEALAVSAINSTGFRLASTNIVLPPNGVIQFNCQFLGFQGYSAGVFAFQTFYGFWEMEYDLTVTSLVGSMDVEYVCPQNVAYYTCGNAVVPIPPGAPVLDPAPLAFATGLAVAVAGFLMIKRRKQ